MRKRQKHHTQESKEVSYFPAGDHTAARNRHTLNPLKTRSHYIVTLANIKDQYQGIHSLLRQN